jgi:ribonuclease P protein component
VLKFSVIPKKYRLDRQSIKRVFESPQKIYLDGFSVYYQTTEDYPKCAIIIPIKVSKKAVVRNRIKRIFKHAFFQLVRENHAPKIHAVFIVNPDFDIKKKSTDLYQIFKIHLSNIEHE